MLPELLDHYLKCSWLIEQTYVATWLPLLAIVSIVTHSKSVLLLGNGAWTYCGLGDPSYRHRKAQQGVVLIVRQTQQSGDVLESLGRSQPVQTGQSLPERHDPCNRGWINLTRCSKGCGFDQSGVDGADDSRRKYNQQLRPVGDVWHCRLRTVEQAKEDVPSMSSVPVNLLCCLLGQAAHRTLHPALEQKGLQSVKEGLIGKLLLLL